MQESNVERTEMQFVPGTKYPIRNRDEARGFEVITSDGTSIRFNLNGGNSAEITAGAQPFVLNIHKPFDDLVGLPDLPDQPQSA